MAVITWTPTVADVGALLRARTVDGTLNVEQGTFTADTRPTDVQVGALISLAASTVSTRVGAVIADEHLAGAAKHLATLYAAMLVETSYFPEQVGGDESVFAALKSLYDDAMLALVTAIEARTGGHNADDDLLYGAPGTPTFAFPVDTGGVLGWGTVF